MCCMQEVGWKGKGPHFVSTSGQGINCGGQEMMQDLEGLEFW